MTRVGHGCEGDDLRWREYAIAHLCYSLSGAPALARDVGHDDICPVQDVGSRAALRRERGSPYTGG